MQRRIVVSVHDVAPSTQASVERLLAGLDALGAAPRVLKVIPNEAGAGDLRTHPELGRLLRQEATRGSELVLHGYTHRVASRLRGPLLDRLRARVFASADAEFMTLNVSEMAERVAAGRAILRDVGLDCGGFCAPGWLAGPELRRVLVEQGFRYQVGMATLWDLAGGRAIRMPWLGHVGAGAGQERLVWSLGSVLVAVDGRAPVLKVFLHPRGLDGPAALRVLRQLQELLEIRHPVTYADLLGRRA